ncbi:hypothetical protein D0Z07_4444 [Hyphodiscus hymeniophilus]|uniref:F-box domain-containing protein n=1 Tax=Hyphodiscus hymeniophilus TaxID=353542 RepID=A0A9P7AXV6_9HELO|nr:hypothetical protein D0Z07_4444 [Hyphodiscus hymeniophilus]
MPALPDISSRRKCFTPRAKVDAEDAWQRTLNIMGLEMLSSNKGQPAATAMASASGISSPISGPSLAHAKTKMTILDLPSETQKEIFKHSSPTDLIALSLVSKHFRCVAAEHLYRSFHIIFPDEEDPSTEYEYPIDGLARGLDTFVTSDYDYAQHLREIILEPLSRGVKNERAYRQYRYSVSCGKFMNTLLLLTLRKAKALETFKWDVRVELSREVFGVLHKIRSLQYLHLRMQPGESLYYAPPAINSPEVDEFSLPGGGKSLLDNTLSQSSSSFLSLGYAGGNFFSLGSKYSKKAHQKTVKSLLPAIKQVPPTISGFKNLKALEVLDMDTLDYVSEIQSCIVNSSSTLSSLRISFSDDLANKSRKPPPEVVSDDDSDQEDEFGQGILPPGPPPPVSSGAADPNGPSKAVKALEEKKKQEAFLAKIFGVEKEDKEEVLDSITPAEPTLIDELRTKFLRTLAPVTFKLFKDPKHSDILGADEAEVLAIIRKFSFLNESFQKAKEGQSQQQLGSVGSSTAKATPASSSVSMDERAEGDPNATTIIEDRGLFDEPTSKKKANKDSEVSNPEDINVEEPEGQDFTTDLDPPQTEPLTEQAENGDTEAKTESSLELNLNHSEDLKDSASNSSGLMDSIALANRIQVLESHRAIHSTTREIFSEAQQLKARIEELKADITAGKAVQQNDFLDLLAAEKAYISYDNRLDQVARDLQDLGNQMDQLTNKGQSVITDENSSMSDYIRTTRGLTLTTLAINLVPIRASVLSRAVDLRVLQSVTLLNVGHQTPFWNVMARENKLAPLSLHKIYTDNVTLPFLAFVSQLDNVTELLLVERTAKARVESTTAKTTVTMEQIRRVVLKKHAPTLKILVIRNEAGVEWDMNAKTTMLLCHRAKLLEELAVSFGVKTMHTFLQFMPGLVSLRVFHTIQFRTDDTCMWVCREFRKFTVDNVSHNPAMKLEWIALDGSVDRLVRCAPVPKQKVDNKGKGKEVAGGSDSSMKKTFTQLVLGSGGVWPDGTSMSANLTAGMGSSGLGEDSDDDDGAEWGTGTIGKMFLRVETIEGMRFCDVTGVRIFERDVLSGRL